MVNGRTVGAVCVALMMTVGAGSSLAMAQAAKKKAAPKGPRAGRCPRLRRNRLGRRDYKTKCAVCHTLKAPRRFPT